MFYERVFKELQSHGVRYLIVGGLAVNLHGYDRITADLDIILSMTGSNIKKFILVAKKLGMKPRIPVPMEALADPRLRRIWIKERNMISFLVGNPANVAEHLDVIISHPIDFAQAYRRRVIVKAGALSMPLLAINDLIRMKTRAGRNKDLIDVRALRRIKELKDE
jgi:hypothetical protein